MDIEKKRKELEYQRVLTSKMDLELKKMECFEQVNRLDQNIAIQEARLKELKTELGLT